MSTNSKNRLHVVDAVRAIALFGVLVMNLRDMAGIDYLSTVQLAAVQGPGDKLVEFLVQVFLDEKFLSAFSFLFGLSFFLLLDRKGGTPGFFWLYSRRLLVLAGFGLINIAFLYWADILLIYAIYGAALLFLVRFSQRVLLSISLIFLVLGPIVLAILGGVHATSPALQTASDLESLNQFSNESYWSSVHRAWELYFSTSTEQVSGPGTNLVEVWDHTNVIGMMLLGFCFGRAGIAHDISGHSLFLIKVVLIGLPLGLILELTRTYLVDQVFISTLLRVGAPILAVGYMAGAALWLNQKKHAKITYALGSSGRLALTNYLLYGLIGQIVFYGWAMGYIGSVGTGFVFLLSAISYVVLSALSWLWLKPFKIGPLEWFWRCMTYLRIEPLRRKPKMKDGSGSAPLTES